MTTTSQFQIKPDYYESEKSCLEFEKKIYNTNPRYNFFSQTHFTAGDRDQFSKYRDMKGDVICKNIDLQNNIFTEMKIDIWNKYHDLHPLAVDNTFNYIFYKFKKGIFLKIQNNKLRVFLPFSNKNFINEWNYLIKISPEYKDMNQFFEKIQKSEGRKFNNSMVNKFIESWYANNCLLRWEYPIHEGDTNISIYSDMLKTLCNERDIPDIEFFINRRDFPLITKNETEPYDHIFGEDKKLVSHIYDKYCPILSMTATDIHADIPIPTGDDWARVTRTELKFFPKTATRQYKIKNIPWKKRKSIAVFRGASTGSGVTIETNSRLKLAFLSQKTDKDTDGLPLLDAGITEWNLRPRKIKNEPYLKTIDINSLPFNLVNTLSLQQQAEYKYIINVDGHVRAFRLSTELENGFCVLLADSKYKLWFSHLMIPNFHYIPIKADLSDLIDKIKWCKNNDKKCEQISKNAKDFANKYLSKNGILDYLQKLLYELKKINGDYRYLKMPISDIISEKELDNVKNIHNNLHTTKRISKISFSIDNERDYGFLKAIEKILYLNKNSVLEKFLQVENQIFKSNSTDIYKCDLFGLKLIKKYSSCNILHEYFVGYILNNLSKQIPNFAYVFNYNEKFILSEYIEGYTFSEWIKNSFNFNDFLTILIQLSLSIYMAQRYYNFIHWDLVPWNIIIKILDTEQDIDYIINSDSVYRIKTKIIPVIVDLEKSHIIYENIHYGGLYIFKNSKIQDIISLLIMSVNEICKNKVDRNISKKIISLCNFICETSYCRKKFTETGYDGLGTVRYFFSKAKKYSTIVSSNKYELENKDPLDFVDYIMKTFCLNIITKDNKILNNFYKVDENQIFDQLISFTRREKAITYARYFHNIEKIKIPDDNLEKIYFIQTTFQKLIETGKNMNIFLEKNKVVDSIKFIKKYNKTVEKIKQIFTKEIDNINIDIPKLENKKSLNFDENTFLFPEKIDSILTSNKCIEFQNFKLDLYDLICLNKNTEFPYKLSLKNIYNQNDIYKVDLNTISYIKSKIY